ncbi:MAG: oligosaccharide flippase family protein [Clostridia bacterium]|nr:oligosaccharide flippase family protein [Clostridia bacterium]
MNHSSKYRTLLKDTLIFALGNIGSKLIVFFLVPFYTLYLSPEEYGISDLVFTVSQLAIPFFSLVIFDAVIRFGIFRKEKPQDALLIGLRVWIFGSVLAFAATPIFGLYTAVSEWKWYITLYISANILLSIELNYLKAINKNISFSLISITQTLILALLNIILVAYYHLGIRGYLISYVASNGAATIIAFFVGKLWKELRKATYDRELAKQMIKYSAPLILNNLSWWVIQSSDKLMLEDMVGKAALGIYAVAARIPSLIAVFVTIFQQAWGISSSKEMDTNNDKGFYSNVFSVYSFIAFLGGIGMCTIIKPFMDIYVRSDSYGEVWRYVPLLLSSAVFSALAAYCGSMYGALKKSMNNMLSTLSAALVNVIVNYLAIKAFGIWGAMIGTIVAYVLLAFIRIIDVKRFVDVLIDWKKLIANSCIVIMQTILISIVSVRGGFLSSGITIILFVIINRQDFIQLKQKLQRRY